MLQEYFKVNKSYLKYSYIFTFFGVVALLAGIFALALSEDTRNVTRFWAVLLQNSVFFLMLVNCMMFLICAVTLSMGGWILTFKRIPEALSALTPLYSILTFIVFLCIIFGGQEHIYHWLNTEHVEKDAVLTWKKGFLNPYFFLIWTVITLLAWSLLGAKMRSLSSKADKRRMSGEESKNFIWRNTVWAGLFMALFTLTMGSVTPWIWLLSIDAHWYSSIYSWYVFASIFTAAVAIVVIYVIYLKSQGYLALTTKEHLHDLGKLLFGFSFFWAYLWYSQYMLIWYADVPEETTYFKIRQHGTYAWIFYVNIVVNFLLPFLLLMSRDTKRNNYYLIFISVILFLGHWIDFYQLVMPGPLGEHYVIGWFELGILCLFIGLTMWLVAYFLSEKSLLPCYDPYFKESVTHHT